VVAIIANTTAARQAVRHSTEMLLRDLSVPLASRTRRKTTALRAYARLILARTSFRG
jgi:hypothetical protein